MFFLRKRIDNAIYLLSKIETNENNNNDRVSKRSRVTTSKIPMPLHTNNNPSIK